MLMNKHYYSYEVVTYRNCDKCGTHLLSTNNAHKCSKEKMSFFNSKISEKKDMVTSNKIEQEKLDYEKVVHWDLETFQPEVDGIRHEIYASGFYDKKYKVYYGKDAAEKTIDKFMLFENRIISAYNACDDFKIKNAKTELEHAKFKSWDDVETHKDEVLAYLKMDVLGLKELFETFNDVIYDIEKTNITKFITCSHMGYEIWRNMMDKIVEIPKDLEKMDYILRLYTVVDAILISNCINRPCMMM